MAFVVTQYRKLFKTCPPREAPIDNLNYFQKLFTDYLWNFH